MDDAGARSSCRNYFTSRKPTSLSLTPRPGATVSLTEALQTCRDILDGRYDAMPVDAFYFSGGMAEIQVNPGRALRSVRSLQSPSAGRAYSACTSITPGIRQMAPALRDLAPRQLHRPRCPRSMSTTETSPSPWPSSRLATL
jgi:hypothetical protein